MPDIVRIGNTVFSWTSSVFKIDNQPWPGIVAVDVEQKRERKVVYGAKKNGKPVGWTAGKYSVPSMSIKMLKDSAEALTTYLTTIGLGSYGDAEFSFMAQCVEPVIGLLPMTMMAGPCCIVGEKDGFEEGIDELLTEFEIASLEVTKNGKRLWSVARGIGI